MKFLGFVPSLQTAVDRYTRLYGGDPDVSGAPGDPKVYLHDKVLGSPQAYAVVE